MTHNEKLNAILHILINNERLVLSNKPIDRRITFEFICNKVADVSEKWEVEYLRKILLNDGYMEMGKSGKGEPPTITHYGIKFIQDGGYRQEAEDKVLDRKIKEGTIHSLKHSRIALIVSIFAIIIPTIISIYSLWMSNQQATSEEMNKLKQSIDNISLDLMQTKNTLDSILLLKLPIDTIGSKH